MTQLSPMFKIGEHYVPLHSIVQVIPSKTHIVWIFYSGEHIEVIERIPTGLDQKEYLLDRIAAYNSAVMSFTRKD